MYFLLQKAYNIKYFCYYIFIYLSFVKKLSDWWNQAVGKTVAEKRRAFERWQQRRNRVTYDRYRAHNVVVKRAVKVCKKNGGLVIGRAIGELFRW